MYSSSKRIIYEEGIDSKIGGAKMTSTIAI